MSQQDLLEAMRQHKCYDPTATTNGARFQAEALLSLARKARAHDPEGLPLFVEPEDWFQAFLKVTGLTDQEAPIYALLAYQHGQRMEIDYRTDRVHPEGEKGALARAGRERNDLVAEDEGWSDQIFLSRHAVNTAPEGDEQADDHVPAA